MTDKHRQILADIKLVYEARVSIHDYMDKIMGGDALEPDSDEMVFAEFICCKMAELVNEINEDKPDGNE